MAYPQLEIVLGTHKPLDKSEFQKGVKEILCPTISAQQTMKDLIKGTLQLPGDSQGRD